VQSTEEDAWRREAEIIRVLRLHGLDRAVAGAILGVGASLRERTRRRATEFAALLDASTGSPVGSVLGGVADEVDIRPHLRALRAGRSYVQVHSHPASTAFSDADALMLVRYPSVHLSCVVGLDGTWYVLGRERGSSLPDPSALYSVYHAAMNSKVGRYRHLARSGRLTPREADRALSHAVWEQIAPGLGLRYDRVEPEGDPHGGPPALADL
jgi:proteasome lid subunit RPN8/RPN11